MIDIGKRREFVWDDFLIDTTQTTAERRIHHAVRQEVSIVFDKPWEGDGCNYYSTVYDDVKKVYRMYYNAWAMFNSDKTKHTLDDVKLCCIESPDGIHWTRPSLGLVEFDGSTDNNIVITKDMFQNMRNFDNFFVMVDDNPNPAVPGRYKAVMTYPELMNNGSCDTKLVSLVSDDGYHFNLYGVVTRKGYFDTLNTIMWHAATNRYICYIRSMHAKGEALNNEIPKTWSNTDIRDIRVLYSDDFITWSDPECVVFPDAEDFPLYTNAVSPYPGAEHMLVGFPSRYVERSEWTHNYDRLCGAEKRAERCKVHPRYGLATTDCLFMCSRDGKTWTRYEEAFLRPGPEFPNNWVYGSCYPNVGLIESPSRVKGADNEWSLYCNDNHWMGIPAELFRLTLRKDGFVSLHAGIQPQRIVTKSFTFQGSELKINFSTSARGGLYITLLTDDGKIRLNSGELFGDSINRVVDFDGALESLAGQSVHMEIELCDADFYAFQFQ